MFSKNLDSLYRQLQKLLLVLLYLLSRHVKRIALLNYVKISFITDILVFRIGHENVVSIQDSHTEMFLLIWVVRSKRDQ